MFWINPAYRPLLTASSLDSYEAIAAWNPTDDFIAKQGRSTGRYRIEVGGRGMNLYVKKHMRLSWWQRKFAAAKTFQGPSEQANIERVAALGVRVPETIFAGADGAATCASLFATRALDGYSPLHLYIAGPLAKLSADARRRRKQALVRRLVDIGRRLHDARLYHRDFYLCHFYLRDDADCEDGFDLVLIDLGRLLESRLSRWKIKDLAGLLFSSEVAGVTRTDRMRFFKQYVGIAKLDAGAKRLARRIEAKAERYRRHNDVSRAA
jgi:heptose I phosphotransferase